MDQLRTWMKKIVSKVSGWCASLGAPQVTDSAKSPESYLNLAIYCMNQIISEVSDPTQVKLYPRQCGYLAEKLETAIKNSRESWRSSLSPEHKAERLGTLKLLYRLAKEVENFIRDCCKEETWMQAALTPATVPLRVSSWGCHLKLCTDLLCNSNKLGAAWLTFAQHERLGEAEPLAVKGMASDDEDALMRLLESLSSLSSESKSNALMGNVELINILLGRLKTNQAMSTVGSPHSSYLEGTGGRSPWEVDLGGLRRLEMVGRSAFASVYRGAWFGSMDVALKIYFEAGNFEQEVDISARLSHPNIVSFFGYGMVMGAGLSIVMELMDGDLRTLMDQRMQEDGNREGPFSILEACDIMLQVAEGVLYMHQNRVVHRDLKSFNILVRSSKDDDADHVCAKVSAFALSKRKEETTINSNQTLNMRSTSWMAPELIRMHGPQDEFEMSNNLPMHPFKWDVYSFGMLCYEILTGEIPFSSMPSPEVTRMVLEGARPEVPRKCPQSVKNLMKLCWDPESITRPSFAEICEELRYIRCSLLLEPQDHTPQPTLLVLKPLDLPGHVSKFKGDYSSLKVVKQLGRGGSDIITVYLSTWLHPDNGVAQKRFIGSHNECFVNEVSIMADLEHTNVVRLLRYATDRRSCSIVMELMDGDLHDLMRRRRLDGIETPTGPFTMDDGVCVILQIARGMEYLHGKSVVHRDLKSCNILVRKAIKGGQFEVKVADFGLSKKLASKSTLLGKEDSGVGTVRWMAPEVTSVHLGSSEYDPFKSDVFSFGMVCYEILVGRVPFYEMENVDEVRTKVLAGERPTLPDWTLSTDLKELVENCWQDDARKRPSFADIVKKLTQRLVQPS